MLEVAVVISQCAVTSVMKKKNRIDCAMTRADRLMRKNERNVVIHKKYNSVI